VGFREPLLLLQLALLSHATIAVATAGVVRVSKQPLDIVLARPLIRSALCTSALAGLPLLVPAFWVVKAGPEATRAFWLAGVWATMAFLLGSRVLFTAAQAALTLAVPLAVLSRLATRVWFQQASEPLLDPRTVQAVGIALTGLSLAWLAVRLGAKAAIRWAEPAGRKSTGKMPVRRTRARHPRQA